MKNRGASALTCAGGSLYTIKLKSACREPDLSLAGLDPVPLSKIGTLLLASLGRKGKNRNSLTWIRNAGFYSAANFRRDVLHDDAFEQARMRWRLIVARQGENASRREL